MLPLYSGQEIRQDAHWNGRLVVAGASGTRSEFNGDFAWSDYVVACRLHPASNVWVHFYDNDPAKPFTQWQERIVEAAQIAREGLKARYGRHPR